MHHHQRKKDEGTDQWKSGTGYGWPGEKAMEYGLCWMVSREVWSNLYMLAKLILFFIHFFFAVGLTLLSSNTLRNDGFIVTKKMRMYRPI